MPFPVAVLSVPAPRELAGVDYALQAQSTPAGVAYTCRRQFTGISAALLTCRNCFQYRVLQAFLRTFGGNVRSLRRAMRYPIAPRARNPPLGDMIAMPEGFGKMPLTPVVTPEPPATSCPHQVYPQGGSSQARQTVPRFPVVCPRHATQVGTEVVAPAQRAKLL